MSHKKTVPITGMHCRSCEIVLTDKLKNITGVENVNVSLKSKTATIISDKNISDDLVEQKVNEAGYKVGAETPKQWINLEKNNLNDLGLAFCYLLIFYLVFRYLGISKINVGSLSNPSSLFIVLLIGLTAGISTCMALVGGLVLGISAKHAELHPEASLMQKFRPHIFFNIGRIISYIFFGGIIGLAGSAFQLSGQSLGIITVIVGLVMLLVGLQLTELFPKLSDFSFSLPSGISKILGIKKRHQKEYSHVNSMLTGAMTFFLPCGFTQAMQVYAISTGSFSKGAMIMGLFALGTMPGLLSVGGLTSAIKGVFAQRFFKFAGLLVVFLALFNISNGANLLGINLQFLRFSNTNASNNSDANLPVNEGDIQIIKMDQISNGYQPNNFSIKKGVPVKWIINSKAPNSCASALYSKKLNIRQFLKAGDNIFEFTPTEIGRIDFSCSMGMYRGWFDVVENPSAQINPQNNNITTTIIKNTKGTIDKNIQILQATYTVANDIQPKTFTVKVNKPARLEIEALEDGRGCMGSIAIPELVENFDQLEKGKTTVFEFTPKNKGAYNITCAMGARRAQIIVE
ncbi:MAG: Heavy metal transport/detoxification protein [Candidatus Berkelbacteria bacterium Licking1014_85]|uniref:Heavy metal transport/detoxification protein n=1 Tax=Candidatus Berkelbacteria bacterium Licking1014_85 TaxID=2017148 RepID=A0A554LLQ9_9BACT|nr:MAG: Heavy metal transport/detoxification protein [Candidatus Berkelbacteria bacterium Licking1014_85]